MFMNGDGFYIHEITEDLIFYPKKGGIKFLLLSSMALCMYLTSNLVLLKYMINNDVNLLEKRISFAFPIDSIG